MLLKIAIAGCGKIADAHAEQIRRIEGCDLVAVCDREALMAQQLADRFRVGRHFSDLGRLLEESKPDVVHVTTPPQSHFELARQCLDSGCHVYVEKPFTLDAREAEELVALAERRGLRLTVGHDAQFSPAARRMRELVREGYLGGAVVHMESYYGYDLGDSAYAAAFLGNTEHWVRRLPGGLLQNVISHGIARIAEFVTGENVRVFAHGFASPLLRSLGSDDVLDELRAVVVDEDGRTAFFTFSSQMRPLLQQFRIFGPKNALLLDELQQTVVRVRGAAFKSYAERFLPPAIFAKEYAANAVRNVRLFLANELHMESGKKELMASFYRSISEGGPLPISYREILVTARLMDSIFEQVGKAPSLARSEEKVPC
ncbi:MAG TPA: Gfo/Idh/MocA family oxidoreductase [Candidatus Methylomirabilis sp.]|nr:Gfo/Idh/MocA family oxidoreductase [Candidatus Methylomirabilis sp.]